MMDLDSAWRLHAGCSAVCWARCLLVPRWRDYCEYNQQLSDWILGLPRRQELVSATVSQGGVKSMGKESQVSVGRQLLLFY